MLSDLTFTIPGWIKLTVYFALYLLSLFVAFVVVLYAWVGLQFARGKK